METSQDYLASSYDLLYADLVEDIPFWVEESHKCDGKILEVGCGTGRVTIPIAKSKTDITGIDISAAMLEGLTEKSLRSDLEINTHLMDMRKVDLEVFFDLIIIPYRGFQHLLTSKDQEKSLFSIRKRLNKRGRLIINIFPPNIEMFDQSSHIFYETRNVELDGKHQELHIRHRAQIDIETQQIDIDLLMRHQDESIICKEQYFRFTLSYLYQKEAEYLFRNCGYKIIDLYGNYDRGSYQPESSDMIWILEKTE